MSTDGKIRYRLINGDEMARQAPETFTMPRHEERQRLRVGDLVKLIFELPGVVEHPAAERMWVRITECLATIPRRYVGTLENDPTLVPLHHGDRVDFGSEHVVDIDDRAATPTGGEIA